MKRSFRFMMDGVWPLSLLFCFLLNSFHGHAQSCDSLQCSCETGDMNPSGIMVGHTHPKGGWMFAYRYMSMQMKDNLSGTNKVSDEVIFRNYIMSPQSMTMNMHMVMAMYGITDRLSVMAMFNYNVLSMSMTMPQGSTHMHMNGMTMPGVGGTMLYKTSGIGDTKVYAMYTLLNKSAHKLILSLGLNIPTGSIMLTGGSESMVPGQRLPYMMQLGSGTYDLLPGITYLLNKDKISWGTQLTGIARPGYNAIGYAYGNELTATSWLGYRFLPWLSASARAELNLADRIDGRDDGLFEVIEPDSKSDNYGGTKLNTYLGMNIYWKKLANSRFSVEYGLPVYQSLNGPQLSSRGTAYAGWTVSF